MLVAGRVPSAAKVVFWCVANFGCSTTAVHWTGRGREILGVEDSKIHGAFFYALSW